MEDVLEYLKGIIYFGLGNAGDSHMVMHGYVDFYFARCFSSDNPPRETLGVICCFLDKILLSV